VDEQMILSKWRHSCKQYIPNRPSPWALKNFVLCGKSGQPYTTSSCTRDRQLSLATVVWLKLFLVHQSLYTLASTYQHLGTYFMDNYFTTYQILELLKTKGINAVSE
jgi:hypothetical protein